MSEQKALPPRRGGPGGDGAHDTKTPPSPDPSLRGGGHPRASVFARVLPLLVFLVAAAVYGGTLARTFTWRHDGADGGDLIAAAATLGVPHPSGYPTYLLLAWLFLRVLPWGEPAFRVHWLSALSAAAAAALLSLSIAETRPAPAGLPGPAEKQRTARLSSPKSWQSAASLCAASAALLFAFSPLAWSQATIAEVHALHVAYVAALFWLLLRWRTRGSAWLALAAAFLYGLSLGNHLTALLLLPAVILWLLAYLRRAQLTRWAWGGIIGAFVLGLAVYVYLPLAAARQPPVNWGDPRTWDRFWWLVSGQLYREAIFGLPLAYLPGRLSAWGHLLREQFGWWGWALALVGLWRLSRRDLPALGFSLYVFAAYSVYGLTYDRADSYVYLLPACLMSAFWLGKGLVTLLETSLRWAQEAVIPRASPVASLLVAPLLVAALPLLPLLGNFAAHDLRQEREAADYATAALAAAEPGALIVSGGDRTTFALWYRCYALGERPDVTVANGSLWSFDWYRHTLAVHHPVVALPDGKTPPDLPELIRASLRERPVYVTGDARDMAGGYRLEAAGPLYRLWPPKAGY